MNNPIVWIDCEMTGLDTAVDELVEVAVVVTDSDLRPADEGIDVLIRPSQSAVVRHVREPGKAPLGGNSICTDKAFLERYMPEVIGHLHYRVVDVSSLKELAKRWYPRTYFASPKKTGNHRALGDIYDSIDELRYYRAVLMPSGEGPSTETCRVAATRAAGTTARLSAPRPPRR